MSNEASKPFAIVGGARPNFMKIVPLARVLMARGIPFYVVNTGQHFSREMSREFFLEFSLSIDFELEPRPHSLQEQHDDIRKGLTRLFTEHPPRMVIVVGDVHSTLIASQVAATLGIPVAHVEAGLRSYNPKMPEEFNRIETDKIARIRLAPSEDAAATLMKEGLVEGTHVVGNIMIDLLKLHEAAVKETDERFYFATLHRAENVDDRAVFEDIIAALEVIAKDATIYLPIHPRTRKMAEQFGVMERLLQCVRIVPALSYVESVYYQKNARLVLTDSGAIQEETSVLGTPCLTLRTETERPITVTHGTNIVAGVRKEGIIRAYEEYKRRGLTKRPAQIPLWDGHTAERIVDVLEQTT